MRRTLTITLHWLTLVLLLAVVSDDTGRTWLALAYAASALCMCALAAIFGLMSSGPGPKLEGPLRVLHPWLHRGLYVLLGWGAAALLAQTLAHPLPGPSARMLLLSLFAAAMLHAVFNMWRHTALGDGALRRITPRAIHHIL